MLGRRQFYEHSLVKSYLYLLYKKYVSKVDFSKRIRKNYRLITKLAIRYSLIC